jgi:hypothetical protein
MISQAQAAKLGKYMYDIFETELLIKLERPLKARAKQSAENQEYLEKKLHEVYKE